MCPSGKVEHCRESKHALRIPEPKACGTDCVTSAVGRQGGHGSVKSVMRGDYTDLNTKESCRGRSCK
jgi:hypothetical protein